MRQKLAPKVGRETIRILLHSHHSKPWRIKSWCVAELTPEYIHKMEDVLATYERPRNENQPVVCVDEKSVQFDRRLARRKFKYKVSFKRSGPSLSFAVRGGGGR